MTVNLPHSVGAVEMPRGFVARTPRSQLLVRTYTTPDGIKVMRRATLPEERQLRPSQKALRRERSVYDTFD